VPAPHDSRQLRQSGIHAIDPATAPTASVSPETTDEALAERVRLRDTAAFGALYDRYAPAVYALAARALGAAEAEEIVQEVFLRLWQRAAQFDPTRSAFGAWFMAIARHRVFDELRRRGQAQRLAVGGDVERLLARAPDPAVDPDIQVWRQDEAHAVRLALAALPDDQRRVLVLGYFAGFTQSAMADLLGWPLGTVKKRVRLGLQKLRRALAPLNESAVAPPGRDPAPRSIALPSSHPTEAAATAAATSGATVGRELAAPVHPGGARG
jgi:RNA polymerase sigma-70 factor, ECF subfamily